MALDLKGSKTLTPKLPGCRMMGARWGPEYSNTNWCCEYQTCLWLGLAAPLQELHGTAAVTALTQPLGMGFHAGRVKAC